MGTRIHAHRATARVALKDAREQIGKSKSFGGLLMGRCPGGGWGSCRVRRGSHQPTGRGGGDLKGWEEILMAQRTFGDHQQTRHELVRWIRFQILDPTERAFAAPDFRSQVCQCDSRFQTIELERVRHAQNGCV